MKKEHLYQLDFLKFIMCFSVVFGHFSSVFSGRAVEVANNRFLLFCNTYGPYTVDLFFMVSGFVIHYVYKERMNSISFLPFMKKRIVGVLPPLILSELLMGLVYPLGNTLISGAGLRFPSFYSWFQSLTMSAKGYIDGTGCYPIATITWYVDILVLLYVVYWIVCYACRKHPGGFIPLCLFVIVFGYICIYYFEFPFLWESNGRGYCSFFVGVLISEFQANEKINKKRLSYMAIIVSLAVFAIASFCGQEATYGNLRMSMTFWIMPSFLLAVLNIPWLKKGLNHEKFSIFGRISRDIYFSHLFTLTMLEVCCRRAEFDCSKLSFMFIAVGLVLVGTILYDLVLIAFEKLLHAITGFFIND